MMKYTAALLKVDLIGASRRLRETLAVVCQGPAKGLCIFADGHHADAVIVDLDSVGAQAEWDIYRNKYPHRPAIVLSLKDGTIEHADEILVKPIKVQAFAEALQRLAKRAEEISRYQATMVSKPSVPDSGMAVSAELHPVQPDVESPTQKVAVLPMSLDKTVPLAAAPQLPPTRNYAEVCGVREDIDTENAELVSGILLSVDNRLLGMLVRAVAEASHLKQTRMVAFKQVPLAVIFPESHTIGTTLNDDMLRNLSGKTFTGDALMISAVDPRKPVLGSMSMISEEAMLWKIAAWTYRGMLPEKTLLQERAYLRHWPNLTRLLELPDAMRISALMIDQPMRLTSVADALGIPQRHVFAFYSCASTIGLMGGAKRATDYLIEPPPEPPEHVNRKLFGRMMLHLKKLVL